MARRSRLNKVDLPEDRGYSRERFWVKEAPDGTVRIGLALPAIQDEPPGVYFVHTRQTGYIQTGRKFGFVDFDSGRLDLVAPLSGRIVKVNAKLVADPKLLADDCFGEGWLLELNRVLPEALRALLDRDSFHGWVRFEREARLLGLNPVLSCTQEYTSGDPWPLESVVKLGGRVVLRAQPVREGRNETFTPQWRLGETWRVRTKYEQPSMAKVPDPKPLQKTCEWQYEVVDELCEVKGELCWALKVIEVNGVPPLQYLLLSIARSDFSLRLIEEVSAHDPTSRTRIPNDWGAEAYVELRRPRELIVDLPLFPLENQDEKRTVEVPEEPALVVEATFPEPKRMKLAIDAPNGRGGAIRSEQVWERGLPWWREARRLSGDRVLISGELLTTGGPLT